MSSKKNAIAYVQMALDAINTVVIYRYSILALLPFLMQNSLGISRWGWCWWTGLVAVVFSALSIQYHMRYNPQLMYDELGNKDSLKLANSRTMQKCVMALTDESLGSKYHEYILSKAVIDIMLTYASLQQLRLVITQLLRASGVNIIATTAFVYGLSTLQGLLSIACIYYASILDTTDTKSFYHLSLLLKDKLASQLSFTPKYEKKITINWYESGISKAISIVALLLSVTRLYYPTIIKASKVLDAMLYIGVYLAALQVLSKLIRYSQDRVLEIIATAQTIVALFSATTTMNMLTKQQWIKTLAPVAKKIGLMNWNASVYSVSNIFYTVVLWVYGISTYRVSLHTQQLKHIVSSHKRTQIIPKSTPRNTSQQQASTKTSIRR